MSRRAEGGSSEDVKTAAPEASASVALAAPSADAPIDAFPPSAAPCPDPQQRPPVPPPGDPSLPTLPADLSYDTSRLLSADDSVSEALLENASLECPLLNGWDLYEHQREGIRRALRMRRLVLAFDMGLGKTVMGCVWSRSFLRTFGGDGNGEVNSDYVKSDDVNSDDEDWSSDNEDGKKKRRRGFKIFVIAPVSLHDDWRRTAAEATGLRVHEKAGKGKKKANGKKKGKKRRRGNKKKEEGRTVTGKPRRRAARLDESDDDLSDCSSSSDEEDEEKDPSADFDLMVLSWQSIKAYRDVVGNSDYVVIADEAHHMQVRVLAELC